MRVLVVAAPAVVGAAVWVSAPACGGGVVLGDGGNGGACSASELEAALARAAPGDTVRVGACRIVGSFTIPAGVTLAGSSVDLTILATDGDGPALRLTPGTPPARAADLSVESAAHSGILAEGDGGGATLERVAVRATRGIALAVEGVESLGLTDVTLAGPVTPENAMEVPPDAGPDEWATHGLAAVRVADADLSGVTASGFVGFGVLLVESATTWRGGGATGNLGTGVMVHAGTATLEDLDLSRTLEGGRLFPAYGAVFASGAVVESSRLVVSDGDRFGLMHDSSVARHGDLVARGNGDAAVWAQSCPSLEISGPGTLLRGNQAAGVVVVDSGDLTITDARIEATRRVWRVYRETAMIEVGDGIQIRGLTGCLVLRDLVLDGNERVGLLLDLDGGTMDCATLDDVTVDGTGSQFGAVAQGGLVPAGWDAGITRLGATPVNDAALAGPLPIAGMVAVPAVDAVALDGLRSIIDPDPR